MVFKSPFSLGFHSRPNQIMLRMESDGRDELRADWYDEAANLRLKALDVQDADPKEAQKLRNRADHVDYFTERLLP